VPVLPLMDEIQFSQAKSHLSELMDDVVHREHLKAVRRARGKNEVMYLLPREVLDAVTGSARVTVDYLPDEDGISLWVNDLEIGAYGTGVEEARQHLIREVRAYVANFLGELPVYLTWPDRARLLPQVLRLAIARSDDELARLLFDPVAD
jgi:antitoxin of RelE/RelB toxin-antitoxin system